MSQAVRFLVVGGSGLIVNLAVIYLCNKLGPEPTHTALDLPGVEYNVRWYHAFATLAFLFANLSNFQLNRSWTFRTTQHASWFEEYWPSLVTGLVGLGLNLGVLTLLLHPHSFLSLPDFFDDSSGLRTRLYWAQFIALAVVTPFSFVLNKYWAFDSVLGHHDRSQPAPDRSAPKQDSTEQV